MKRLFLAACFLALAHAHAQDYPPGALPMASDYTGANTGGATVSMPYSGLPPPNKTVYTCGFSVSGLGATAATSAIVGLINVQRGDGLPASPQFIFYYPAGVTTIATPVTVTFTPCLQALSPNITMGLNMAGAAGNTLVSMVIWGYAK
jgi:hypothetical protein